MMILFRIKFIRTRIWTRVIMKKGIEIIYYQYQMDMSNSLNKKGSEWN